MILGLISGGNQFYGLSWTSNLPEPGLDITASGEFMECDIGQALDLGNDGYFTASNAPGVPGFLSIGSNQKTRVQGVHIMVGVKDSTGNWSPIFVDPVALNINQSGSWQPQENVQFWYDNNTRSSAMIDNHKTKPGNADFSQPDDNGNFHQTATYSTTTGEWKVATANSP